MNRVLLPLVVVVIFGLGLWFALIHRSPAPPRDVATLLPPETLAFAHAPDINRTLARWRETHLYRLWEEPQVQEFLRKPLDGEPNVATARQRVEQLERIEMRDLFAALVPSGEDEVKLVGGFRFSGPQRIAEEVIAPWRTRIVDRPDVKRETVQHQRHRIEVFTRGETTRLASVFSGDWFFAANDVAALQAVLDRADGRAPTTAPSFLGEQDYANHLGRMPHDYALFGFARVERLLARRGAALRDERPAGHSLLRQMRGLSVATRFDGGNLRDTVFAAMPRVTSGELTRSSLALASTDTFLYAAGLLDLPQETWAQATTGPLARSGITPDEWRQAFGPEVGLIGEWPAASRFPGMMLVAPVRDATRANDIMSRIAAAADEESWRTWEREGARYYSRAPENAMLPVAPTVGIGPQLAILGVDPGAVEAAMAQPQRGADSLATAQQFTFVERAVPAPGTSFLYFDLPLFYTRLDAALRPMLIMAAAFAPDIAQRVDLGALPPPEVVVRHLSPIVVSQTYDGEGYMTMSVGPVPLYPGLLPLITGWNR